MPIIKSAKKRMRTEREATIRNLRTKRSLKAAIKEMQHAIAASDKKRAAEAGTKAQSRLDTAVKKGVMHKNKAAREKSRLAAQAKSAGVTQTASAKTATTTKTSSAKTTTSAKKSPAKSTSSEKSSGAKRAAQPQKKAPAKKSTTTKKTASTKKSSDKK
jgi:small subunit ribosomal protein S20